MIVDQHELRVYSGAVELDPLENAGTLTADKGWSPHVQGRLTVRAPADLADTAPGSTIVIELTQRFGDFALTRDLTDAYTGDLTSDLTTAFGGGLTSDLTAIITAASWNTPVRAATGRRFELLVLSRTRTRDDHTLELASIEAPLLDWVWLNMSGFGSPNIADSLVFEADTPARFISALLQGHFPIYFGDKPDVIDRAVPTRINPTEFTIEPTQPTIGAAQPWLTYTRQRLYSPGDGTIQIVDYDYEPPGEIIVEDGLNLIDWEVTDDRFLRTAVRFTGTIDDPDARPILTTKPEPGDAYSPIERFIESPSPPPPGIGGLFSGISPSLGPYLHRIGLDESPLRLVTINDYSVMPGSPITYTLPDEAEEDDSIDALTWQLGGEWHMDIWV